MAELLIDLLKSNKSISVSTVVILGFMGVASSLANGKANEVLTQAKQASNDAEAAYSYHSRPEKNKVEEQPERACVRWFRSF